MNGISVQDSLGMTATRLIVHIVVGVNAVPAGFGVQRVTIGIAVADQEAFAAVVLPDPDQSDEHPVLGWMYRSEQGIWYGGTVDSSTMVAMFDVDLKGQRKIGEGELYQTIVTNNASGAAATLRVTGLTRVLVKLA